MHSASDIDELSPAGLLEHALGAQARAQEAEVELTLAAVAWADVHPAPDDEVGAWDDDDHPSLPRVRWDGPAELGATLHWKTERARNFLLANLEARHRLPRVWEGMCAGAVEAWRVRRIAEATLSRPDDVARAVDEIAAPIAHKIGLVTLDRLIHEAMVRLHPDEVLAQSKRALDGRYVRMHDQVSHEGVASIEIRADLKDCLDFTAAVSQIAAALADAGCPESLDVRKSMAVGVLADPHRAADLLDGRGQPAPDPAAGGPDPAAGGPDPAAGGPGPAPGAAGPAEGAAGARAGRTRRKARRRKQMFLHVHLSQDAVTSPGCGDVGRLEELDLLVLAGQIREWCGRDDTDLTVLPVRDLAEHIAVDSYEVRDRLSEQTRLKLPRCVFPWCTRPARRCDCDHVIAYADGGRTCSCNVAPLCRHHHRLKTFTLWSYTTVEPGVYLWRAPHGRCYLRDHTGTVDVTPPGTADPSGCQRQRAP